MSRISVLIAVPTFGKASVSWWRNFNAIQKPLGSISSEIFFEGTESIAEKRNMAIEAAIANDAKTLLFVGDDVHVPSHALELMLKRHRLGAKVVTGVYWTKTPNPQPYIYRGYLDGAFYDWKVGEYFEIDWAGCDCLMLDVEMLKTIPKPWFSLDYNMALVEERPEGWRQPSETEDLYFYSKLKDAGVKVMCDAAIQCYHEDRDTHLLYGVCDGMPQKDATYIPEVKGKRIADIGCGKIVHPLYQNNTIVRFDCDEGAKPDFVCDIRYLPVETESFDMARANHVLEHLEFKDVIPALQEWGRILKVGGTLSVKVPNLAFAAKTILNDGPYTQDPRWFVPYELLMIYGSQEGPPMFHKSGFTLVTLESFATAALGESFEIKVEASKVYHPQSEECDELTLTAKKIKAVDKLKNIAWSYLPNLKSAEKPELPKVELSPKPAPSAIKPQIRKAAKIVKAKSKQKPKKNRK
jgi:SAM-dependent methyltransferase